MPRRGQNEREQVDQEPAAIAFSPVRACQSATECLRSARDHFHALEDGSLLTQAARLLQDVQPTRELHHASPAVASFDTFDQGATLLRVSSAVAECVEQRLRVETELEAVAEVDAICEVESAGPSARRALRGRR
jgi:hypothetical protein